MSNDESQTDEYPAQADVIDADAPDESTDPADEFGLADVPETTGVPESTNDDAVAASTTATPSGGLKYTLRRSLNGETMFSGVYATIEKAEEAEKSVYDRLLKWYGAEGGKWTLEIVPVQQYMKLREFAPNPRP